MIRLQSRLFSKDLQPPMQNLPQQKFGWPDKIGKRYQVLRLS